MFFLIALLIIASLFATRISDKIGVPVLVVFLGVGILVGNDCLGLVQFNDAKLTKQIADVLLIFILFSGGFCTTRSDLQLVAKPAISLATLGVALTAVALGACIHFIMDFDWMLSMIIGSIISSTDAAAVFLITKQNPIQKKLAATLNVESAANDPMAILLTLAFVGSAASGSAGESLNVLAFFGNLAWQFSGGIVVGFAASHAARFLFNNLRSENRGYYYVLIIGVILFGYGVADLIRANGIIAVFFMGYWLGNSEFVLKRGVSHFLEGISTFCNMALFLMLGLLAFPRNFLSVWKEGLLIAALMIFVARPIALLISTFPFRYTKKEKLFLCWGGIKGAVPIVLATYPAAYGLDGADSVFNIIFFAVLVSCLLQGSSLGKLAKWLKLTVPQSPKSPFSVELYSLKNSSVDMFEFLISKKSFCAGKTIQELNLGQDVLITSITRKANIIPPKGGVCLEPDDILFILAPRASHQELQDYLESGSR